MVRRMQLKLVVNCGASENVKDHDRMKALESIIDLCLGCVVSQLMLHWIR